MGTCLDFIGEAGGIRQDSATVLISFSFSNMLSIIPSISTLDSTEHSPSSLMSISMTCWPRIDWLETSSVILFFFSFFRRLFFSFLFLLFLSSLRDLFLGELSGCGWAGVASFAGGVTGETCTLVGRSSADASLIEGCIADTSWESEISSSSSTCIDTYTCRAEKRDKPKAR